MPSICTAAVASESECASITPSKRKLRSHSAADSLTPSAPACVDGSSATPTRRRLRSSPSAAGSGWPGSPVVTPKRQRRSPPIEESPSRTSACAEKRTTPCRRRVNSKLNFASSDWDKSSPAKRAMQVASVPGKVICREEEQRKILELWKECVISEKAGSLYVCGLPGTGKSLSMESARGQLLRWAGENDLRPPEFVSVNCTCLSNPSEIFSKIAESLDARAKTTNSSPKTNASSRTPLQWLQHTFSRENCSRMIFVVADELDYLITADRGVLHELFMLSSYKFSKCVVIGVANSIDLADRFLPKLRSLNCKPSVVAFKAYSVDQIQRILHDRVKDLPSAAFDPQALELCARKVASATGDMRVALAVCSSAIDILESEVSESDDRTSAPVVRVDHMANALSKAFKSPVVDTIKSLPLHQQIILYSAVKCFQFSKDANTSQLNKSYLELCKSINDCPNSTSEFMAMCRVLGDQGLLSLGSSRHYKSARITLKVEEADVTFALQGVRLFRTCLS